jgi:hypothetical protein
MITRVKNKNKSKNKKNKEKACLSSSPQSPFIKMENGDIITDKTILRVVFEGE